MNKFFRFNIPVVYFDDIVMQRMSCMNSVEGDVVVLISHTGRTKNLVEMAHLARENDATVIAITSKDTPLAQAATLPYCWTCRKTPMFICQWCPELHS